MIRNGRILMLRRRNTGWNDGKYSVVAGHVESNEAARTAMAREAKEEAGITIRPGALEFVHLMHRKGDAERIDFFFRTRGWRGAVRNMEPEKASDLQWFSLERLPKNTIPYIRQAIAHIRKGSCYSEFGW